MVESTRRLSPLRISHPCAAISWATHVRKIRCEDETDNDKETEETTQGSAGIRYNGSQIEKGGLVLHITLRIGHSSLGMLAHTDPYR